MPALRAPIVQATLGSCDGPRLAAAVSRAGGLGTLTLDAPTPEAAQVRLARVRARTASPVLIAFTAEWERESILDLCFESGFRHFHLFWWNGPRLARRIQQKGGVVCWQVGTLGQADEALAHGADILIIQGTEAGGPVRSPHSLQSLLPTIKQFSGASVPLIAGGGLASAADVAQTLELGADAALLGTRFLLSQEANAPLAYKRRLLKAKTEQLVLDTRLIGDWPCSPRRRLPTQTLPDCRALYAGKGLSEMRELPSAAQLVTRLSVGL